LLKLLFMKNGITVSVDVGAIKKQLKQYPTIKAYCTEKGVSHPVLGRILLTGRASERIATKLTK